MHQGPVTVISPYYRPSGKVSLLTLPSVAVVATLVFPLDWLYAWLTWEIPFVYINFLITFGFGLILGVATMTALDKGHCRNRTAACLGGMLIGLAGWYSQWGAWLHMVLAGRGNIPGWLTLCTHPGQLWSLLAYVNEVGVWSLRRSSENATGAWLDLFWGIECFILLGCPVLGAWLQAGAPYSETHRRWFAKETLTTRFAAVEDIPAFVSRLELDPRQAAEALGELASQPCDADRFARVDFHVCPGEEIAYLSLDNVTWSTRNGKRKEQRETVLSYLRTPSGLVTRFV